MSYPIKETASMCLMLSTIMKQFVVSRVIVFDNSLTDCMDDDQHWIIHWLLCTISNL